MRSLTTRTGLTLTALAFLGLAATGAHAQSIPSLSNSTTLSSFTQGDLVVSRVNDGSAVGASTVPGGSGYSASVYLDEYTTAGLYQGTFALPAAGTNAFSLSNAATSEGALTLSAPSANGAQVLTIGGYNAASGTAAIAATKTTGNGGTVNRTVDAISSNGTGTFISQGPTDFSGNNIRSAVSTDGAGTTIYANGATTGVVETNGGMQTTVSTTNTNERVLNIANGSLYYSTGSGGAAGTGIYQVGTGGLPTASGTPSTQLINTTSSPYDFYFANANTVYVADSTLGLEKYTSATGAAGSFALAYTASVAGLTGLTAVTNGGVTTLYGVADAATNATATATAINNNTLYSFTDSGAALTSTALVSLNTDANGTTNYAFRGVDFAPAAPNGASAAPEPSQLGALALVSLGLGGLILRARKRSVPQAA